MWSGVVQNVLIDSSIFRLFLIYVSRIGRFPNILYRLFREPNQFQFSQIAIIGDIHISALFGHENLTRTNACSC